MKIIRRFFTYLITIIAVLVLTYGYVYWGDLFGKETPAGQLISWMMAEDRQVAAEPESVPPEPIAPVAEPTVKPIAEPVIDLQAEISEEVVAAETLDKAESVADELPPASTVSDESLMPVDVPAESALPAIDADSYDMAVADEAAAVAAEPEQGVIQITALGDLWKRARHSFHYRDYQASVDSYQQLIARTQDNFDAYEELGDVHAYYGKNEEAASAYYEAASILVRLGKLERAAGFMKALSLNDVNKARALLDQLETAK